MLLGVYEFPIWMMNILIISSLLQICIFSRLWFYLFAGFSFLHFDGKTYREQEITLIMKYILYKND